MKALVSRHWFLVGLAFVIVAGILAGVQLGDSANSPSMRIWFENSARGLTGVVLFLMSFTLDSRKLAQALRSPRAVLWASVVNFAVLPLLAWPASMWQQNPDYLLGVIITASVPSTMASASVWTRKAGGNDAVSLLVTILTNGLCFVVTPLWLRTQIGATVSLDTHKLVVDLLIFAMLPIALGQLSRLSPPIARIADAFKTALSNSAQVCILIIIFGSALRAGPKIASSSGGLGPLLVVVVSMATIHLAAIAIAWWGGKLLGLPREDALAAAFAGSQKTLPIGAYLASRMAEQGASGLVVFPILFYHISQLVIDSLIADRAARSTPNSPGP
jgi:sodium/bile acid cotransporter 7